MRWTAVLVLAAAVLGPVAYAQDGGVSVGYRVTVPAGEEAEGGGGDDSIAEQGSATDGATPGAVPTCLDLSLYCIQLLPTDRFEGAMGHIELARPDSPFGVAVTREGRQRYRLILDIDGLPEPSSIGPYSHYVLWAMPLTLYPETNMGLVGNGHFEPGVVEQNKFMLIVSAEARPDGAQREGPLVLRGRSPSSLMVPHDIFQASPFVDFGDEGSGGHDHGAPLEASDDRAAGDPGGDVEDDGHTGHGGDASELVPLAGGVWPMPPMHPKVSMFPGMEEITPDARPWLPLDSGELPLARPREILRLAEGDSIVLRAHPVRKRVAGRGFVMLGYNGQLPGPLLDVKESSTVTVTFINDTPFASSIHWHGLRHDNRFDGVPGLTQVEVAPADTFVYQVHFPDAGIYWYHPHHRADIQQDLGLYGNMIVRSDDFLQPVDREEVLVFDDFTIAPSGNVPYGMESANYMLMGRFGSTLLVNAEPRLNLDATQGQVVRLYLTNVSNTRTMNLSIPGHALKAVASDLSPFEREVWAESVPIAPAERYVVDVRFDEAGRFSMVNHVQALDHLKGNFFTEVDTLIVFDVAPASADSTWARGNAASAEAGAGEGRGEKTTTDFASLAARPDITRDMNRFEHLFDAEPTHAVELFLRPVSLAPIVDWMISADQTYFNPVEWSDTMPMMNWSATGRQVDWVIREPSTGKENMEIEWRFERGSAARIRIQNRRDHVHAMQHPIHLHGQRFLVVAYNGRRVENMAWKDTVLIPAGMTADIVVEFTNPGDWMMHCHIAEHLEGGMKAVFHVD